MSGVRAEPKYLREATSLETLSSGLSRLSSYVTSNLPKIKTSTYPPYVPAQDPQLLFYQQQLLQQQRAAAAAAAAATTSSRVTNDKQETITFARFEKMDTVSGTLSCLLLGYEHGFQIWNVSQPDNVHELASVRNDSLGTITQLHVLSPPTPERKDHYSHVRPLLAIISADSLDDTVLSSTTSSSFDFNTPRHHRQPSSSSSTSASKKHMTYLHLYSLKTHEFIASPNLNLQDGVVLTDLKSNRKVVALGCKSQHASSIHLLSSHNLSQDYLPLTDVYNDKDGPAFTLGSRFLAYATSSPVINNDTSHRQNTEKDVKGAAKDIAKEMVNGVKSLSEFGYNRLSTYFLSQQQQQQQQFQRQQQEISGTVSPIGSNPLADSPFSSGPTDPATPSNTAIPSPPPNSVATAIGTSNPSLASVPPTISRSSSSSSSSPTAPTGMVIIRDIVRLATHVTSAPLSSSTVAHFKPHMHPVAILAFNPAGNLLMSVSKQGHTFHVFSLYPTDKHLGNAAHLYSLSRGYTDAKVEDCQFSIDSTWCAVTTARGTTHMYTINPYGGKPEINGHVNGRINNLSEPPFTTKRNLNVTSLGPAVRVKQRRPMLAETMGSGDDFDANNPITAATSSGLCPSSLSLASSSSPPAPAVFRLDINLQRQPTQMKGKLSCQKPHANLTTMFLSTARVPQQLPPHSAAVSQSSQHEGATVSIPPSISHPSTYNSSSPVSLASIRNQASTLVSQVSSYLPSHSQRTTDNNSTLWTNDKASDNRVFGFDEEEFPLDNDDSVAKMTNDNTGYQDVYSFHPQGILTLHRLWVTKTMVRKKVQGRTVGKWDLSVKEEDIAEWQVARSSDWKQVGVPILPSSLKSTFPYSMSSSQHDYTDDGDDERDYDYQNDDDNVVIGTTHKVKDRMHTLDNDVHTKNNKASNSRKKKKHQQKRNDNSNNSNDSSKGRDDAAIDQRTTQSHTKQSDEQHDSQHQHVNQWLSHAEIMTYATTSNKYSSSNTRESTLWSNPQFSFQVYVNERWNGATLRSMLSSGVVPPTEPVVTRAEIPEPYSSRLNRIGKTSAKARSLENQEEEYMDDALAELEENLSTAMQTSFVPSSSTASPRRGIRLSSSAGAAHSSSPLTSTAGFTNLKKTSAGLERTSSLSFEDAYLISLGGAPVYRAAQTPHARQPLEHDDVYATNAASTTITANMMSTTHDGALIQFDSDDDTDVLPERSSRSRDMDLVTSNMASLMQDESNTASGSSSGSNRSAIEKHQHGKRNSAIGMGTTSYSSLDGSFDIQGLDMVDNEPVHTTSSSSSSSSSSPIQLSRGEIVFSPDGDNEMGFPSESVMFGR